MTLNDIEKINYIKNTFHQYFDLTLNTNIETAETVNLVIPIDTLTKQEPIEKFSHYKTYEEDYDIQEILDKYNDTTYEKEVRCFLVRVKDGDTIVVSIPYQKNDTVLYREETIRLVGVNTPETTDDGADVSKEFLTKALNVENEIFLNIDNQREKDNYGRTLAVVISGNKNINEILLKEGLAEIWYIPPSEFNPYEWGTVNTPIHTYQFSNDDISILSPYFNADMTNIVFTPQSNYNVLYKYEIYNGVIYVKLNPFSLNIRMHVLPKAYDCSDTVLFFKDSMLAREDKNLSLSIDKNVVQKGDSIQLEGKILDNTGKPIAGRQIKFYAETGLQSGNKVSIAENSMDITDDYHHYFDKDYINAYYHINDIDRDRDNPSIASERYNINKWKKTYCDFSYDISKDTKTFNNIQICAGYRYNKTTPYYSIHYTGIRDNTNIAIEDRCTLIDANYDKIETIANNITQYHYDSNKVLYIPKSTRDIKGTYQTNINHINADSIGKLHRKTIKYINDIMYSEENKDHAIGTWVDLSLE